MVVELDGKNWIVVGRQVTFVACSSVHGEAMEILFLCEEGACSQLPWAQNCEGTGEPCPPQEM